VPPAVATCAYVVHDRFAELERASQVLVPDREGHVARQGREDPAQPQST